MWIASSFDRSVHDSIYVALAIESKSHLITADEKLAGAIDKVQGAVPRASFAEPTMKLQIRLANLEDVPVLQALIEASVRGLQAGDYSPEQIEAALKTVYGVDTRLIEDRTYFVAEVVADETDAERADDIESAASRARIVGCGGWSKRKTLFGGDQWNAREDEWLDPAKDAAKIRAFFVRPEWARRGVGTMILDACERAAKMAGFKRLEMGATISGVGFYKARGYLAMEPMVVPLGDGKSMPIVRMGKKT